ncbi:mechanosensitive ion channel family protein [Microbacterium indicum]|uniref:mechanosensitive ion channel family protein n=1 Tax=Microbacterium indicum TaxID=358100 RepID=UPI0003FB90FD|nr:mechanosensitive ion channel domain-containing protein [Microbacterium indicum]
MTDDVDDLAATVSAHPWAAWITVTIAAASVFFLALLISWIFRRVCKRLGTRHRLFAELAERFPRPVFCAVLVVGLFATVPTFFPDGFDVAETAVTYTLTLATIAVFGWIIGKVIILLVDGASLRQAELADDDFTRRSRETQITLLRRIIVALVAILTVAAMLLTIPGARAFGASMFASAGLVSVVAGLAAQSTLGNLIAGLQLAFSNALKVGDTVEVVGEVGTVEEITLTYVVVRVWDDRRVVLPSTHFTTTPYTNRTRSQTEIAGTVLVEADYAVDVDAMRQELETILDATPLWDRRLASLVVSDAVGGVATLSATVSAKDGDDLGALRALVREKLIAFLAAHRTAELRRTRVEQVPPAA